ncbi:MAG: hypothetical protein WC346_06780 [Methanogenium sp.]|jgi:hypothetical protein
MRKIHWFLLVASTILVLAAVNYSDRRQTVDGLGVTDSELKVLEEKIENDESLEKYDLSFVWRYDSSIQQIEVSLVKEKYLFYKNIERHRNGASYVTYKDNDILELAKHLRNLAADKDYNEVSFIISFVQSFEYVLDSVDNPQTGVDDYPKYPIETLVEGNGDCEDKSYLAASILKALKYDVVLVIIPRTHMAIAIKGEINKTKPYYNLDGEYFYYIELTAKGWTTGDMPREYAYVSTSLIKIPSDKEYDLYPENIYGTVIEDDDEEIEDLYDYDYDDSDIEYEE